jgi:hypothetical protein
LLILLPSLRTGEGGGGSDRDLSYREPSSRQSAIDFSPVVGIGTPPTPHPQASVPPPLWYRVEGHTRWRERGWESPDSDEGTYTVVLCTYVLCAENHSNLSFRPLLSAFYFIFFICRTSFFDLLSNYFSFLTNLRLQFQK